MKGLSSTEAELKKWIAYKKSCKHFEKQFCSMQIQLLTWGEPKTFRKKIVFKIEGTSFKYIKKKIHCYQNIKIYVKIESTQGAKYGFAIRESGVVFGKQRIEITTFLKNCASAFL